MFSGMNYVYEVYKEQSFSKAAENLYISQPALSSMIKKIETKIGMPLFDRSTSPIQLTECGKKYIKTAEKIMDLENEFAYYVGNLQELKTGRLSVGGTILGRAGIQLNYTLKLNQLLTTYHLTEYGMGASFVSDTVVKCLPENPDIIYYKIDDPEAVRDV